MSEDLLKQIRNCYIRLSPENVSCDGELSRAETKRRERQILTELKTLFKQLGREVSEAEAFNLKF